MQSVSLALEILYNMASWNIGLFAFLQGPSIPMLPAELHACPTILWRRMCICTWTRSFPMASTKPSRFLYVGWPR